MILLLLGSAAVFIGLVASMIGVGGGIFMVPLLSLSHLVGTTQEAVGTSLAAVVFTSISSTLAYRSKRVIQLKLGLWLMPATILGAWTGAYLTRFISSGGLSVAFGLLLLYPAVMMLRGRQPREIAGLFRKSPAGNNYSPIEVFLLGLGAGLASGFFGIGGGIVMVPAITIFLRLDILEAVATSLFVMGPSALIGTAQHLLQGNLHLELALPLIVGIVIGAQLGPRLSTRLPRARLRQLFGLALAYSAVNMILSGIS